MKYAIIRINGKQYKVKEGEEISVEKLRSDKPQVDILLYSEDGKVVLGTPVIKDAKMNFNIVEKEEKGDKITVLKYKAKSRHRVKRGFRPLLSKIKIEKISLK